MQAAAAKEMAWCRDWLVCSAIFARAILTGHVFEDGNKRTAAAVIMLLMEMNDVSYKPEAIPRIIVNSKEHHK